MKVKFNLNIKHSEPGADPVYYEKGKSYDLSDDLAAHFLEMKHVNVFVPKFDEDVETREEISKAEVAPVDAAVSEPVVADKTPKVESTNAVDKLVNSIEKMVNHQQAPAQPAETVIDASKPQA
jgi:hypothetical protein